jgi:hypothetical protein
MRLSREKIDQLVGSDDVEFIEDRETIRQHLINVLNALLKEEERIDTEVRKKITSQKKEIPEGSPEWDILFKKYYSEEMKRIGAGPER